jgi:phospholipid/cholesterol/gamma-HCH transport system permease protein
MLVLRPLGEFGFLFWRVIRTLPHAFRDHRRVSYQLDHVGVNSIPIILVIGLFTGAIIAWQGAYQFKGMVTLSILGGQTSRVIMMEMAPILTALIVSGRIGASMAAEIGTMKVTEQIDALKIMAIDPVRYVVLPRFLGLTLMMPVLTLFTVSVALVGAYFVADYFLHLGSHVFFGSVRDFFHLSDLLGGLAKSAIFGMMISLIGCFKGLSAEGGAQGVGTVTISAFVVSSVCILAGDFLLWIILF